jgi:hypothetical protein
MWPNLRPFMAIANLQSVSRSSLAVVCQTAHVSRAGVSSFAKTALDPPQLMQRLGSRTHARIWAAGM